MASSDATRGRVRCTRGSCALTRSSLSGGSRAQPLVDTRLHPVGPPHSGQTLLETRVGLRLRFDTIDQIDPMMTKQFLKGSGCDHPSASSSGARSTRPSTRLHATSGSSSVRCTISSVAQPKIGLSGAHSANQSLRNASRSNPLAILHAGSANGWRSAASAPQAAPPAGNHRAAASALSSGRVLKAIAARGAPSEPH